MPNSTSPESVTREVPDVLAGLVANAKAAREEAKAAREAATAKAKAARELAKAAREAKASLPREETARDFVRAISRELVIRAGELFAETEIPEALRAEVAELFANRLHHLAVPKDGWPTSELPVPDRSEWK